MPEPLEISVGPRGGDFLGRDHRVLQAAVEYVAARGGGTVRLLPGTYSMGNSLFLRSGVRVVGAGEKTVLLKSPSAATRLVDDLDWYGRQVTVRDPSIFAVGGGILLRGRCPHYERNQCVKRTVIAINGATLTLDRQPRENFWIDAQAEAATLFPVITGEGVRDVVIEDLVIDGNRDNNERLDGNYAGCIFFQDCNQVTVRGVTAREFNGDGISWQVCDDVRIEDCACLDNADLGLHPGSGSQRPLIINNTLIGNSIGLFFCWGVQHGLARGNTISDSRQYGLSIGHRDTDNLIQDNVIQRSGVHGVLFREHPHAGRDPHRNVLEGNLIADSGLRDECVAIEIKGAPEGLILRHNRIADSRRKSVKRNRVGLRINERVPKVTLVDNSYEGLEQDVVDLRLAHRPRKAR